MCRDLLLPQLCVPHASRGLLLPGPGGRETLSHTLETVCRLLFCTMCQIFIRVMFTMHHIKALYPGLLAAISSVILSSYVPKYFTLSLNGYGLRDNSNFR